MPHLVVCAARYPGHASIPGTAIVVAMKVAERIEAKLHKVMLALQRPVQAGAPILEERLHGQGKFDEAAAARTGQGFEAKRDSTMSDAQTAKILAEQPGGLRGECKIQPAVRLEFVVDEDGPSVLGNQPRTEFLATGCLRALV